MTVGLMGSELLAKCISEQLKGTAGSERQLQLAALTGLPAKFHSQLGGLVDYPWTVSVGPDAQYVLLLLYYSWLLHPGTAVSFAACQTGFSTFCCMSNGVCTKAQNSHLSIGCAHANLVSMHSQQSSGSITVVTEWFHSGKSYSGGCWLQMHTLPSDSYRYTAT